MGQTQERETRLNTELYGKKDWLTIFGEVRFLISRLNAEGQDWTETFWDLFWLTRPFATSDEESLMKEMWLERGNVSKDDMMEGLGLFGTIAQREGWSRPVTKFSFLEPTQ